MRTRGIRILEVDRQSPGAAIGLRPGDRILAIDGHEVQDELALRFHTSRERFRIRLLRADGSEQTLPARLSGGAGLGVRVEEFATRTCRNRCLFCFVDQLPPGARPSLRVKDDDYRLSFLHGNYVTLTNVSEGDIQRILRHRLSPLYVSVHATEPAVRARLLGRKSDDGLAAKLRRLLCGGIRLHAQVVLVPGINDGRNLEQTVFDLYRLGAESVAIVPLGLSGHGTPRLRLTPVTAALCREVLCQVSAWQRRFRSECGRTFAYLADEFYIQAAAEIPGADHYDDYAQIEDGVGMVRSFLDAFDAGLRRMRRRPFGLRGTLLTGRLFFSFLRDSAERFNSKFDSELRVRACDNAFFGGSVTVAGLLGGCDVAAALEGPVFGDFVVVPGEALSPGSGLFADDMSLQEISRRIGRPVFQAGRTAGDFLALLSRLAGR